jgi:diguanylate cyclase (GGDEF)-like protein
MTGLSNRPHFTESIEHAVSKALNSGAGSAIIYITIDNLSSIQSEVSLAAADLVLGDVAMLLRREVNEAHPLARFADDVFTILLPEGSPRTVLIYASALATKIEDNISQAEGQTLQATCSIGIAMINDNTDNGKTALAKALEAANTARTMDAARGCVFLYEEESENTDEAKQVMAKKLEVALNAGQFKLLFQPIISLRGSGNRYYEVLLRMVDEGGAEISPNHFLEHAEKLQVTAKLDKWVIIQSLKLLSEDIAKGNETHLIINLTASSLQDQSFVPWVQNALKAANVAASQLIFQFNEADAGNFLNDAKEISKALALIKCECVLSRFGCSLKPFNLLKHLRVKFVKIDGSYTLDIQNHNEDPKSLINLIKELHNQEKHTIVTFVENASVLSTLWQAGAHYIQGHYLQAPSAKMDYDFSSDN